MNKIYQQIDQEFRNLTKFISQQINKFKWALEIKKMILLEEANHAIGLADQHVAVSLEIMEKENEGILAG